MMSRPGSLLTAILIALALAGSLATTVAAGKGDRRARDCVADSMLDGRHADSISFVVWCSVLPGEFRFELERGKGKEGAPAPPIRSFTAHPAVGGPGAVRPASCRLLRTDRLRCHGRKSAQVTVRGSVIVPRGTRCDYPVRIETSFSLSGGRPQGCPGTRPYRASFDRAYMRRFRQSFGLLQGIEKSPEAIARRLDAAIRNWRRGDPVARVSATEIGMPLLPFEERAIVFRDRLLRNARKLEHWVGERSTDTYAGYYIQEGLRATLRVGFTGDQEAQLAAFKREFKLFAPGHVQPFPDPPEYTESELWLLSEQVWEPMDSPLAELINSSGVLTELNKVEIGTLHVARVKRLIAERFGPDAPFQVVRVGPAIPE